MRDTTPEWARWNALAAARPWTVGIEDDATAELAWLRRSVDDVLRSDVGLGAASAVGASMRALARREPTMGRHVHVAARALAARHGLGALPERLAAEFAVEAPVSVVAG